MPILKNKYHKLDDEQLMEYLPKGDTSAFNELHDRYSNRLLHYFFRMLGGDEVKAQDFLQDTFLKIVEKTAFFLRDKKFSKELY